MATAMARPAAKFFDLNIVDILEAWAPHQAVRELIANAIDESLLTNTSAPTIEKHGKHWIITDAGRGLRPEHLAQNESSEKLDNPNRVIGKFGVGLKDAIAVLHRHDIGLEIRSAHATISFVARAKHGFDDVPTVHAVIEPPRDPNMRGTEVILTGIPDDAVAAAKSLFLQFSGDEIIGDTPHGQVIRRDHGLPARIFVNGVVIAEDESFAFSYNITSLNAAMRKALNRERTNVGRSAFSERIRSILLQCKAPVVAELLADEIGRLDRGTAHDEVKWTDVAIHACKILNATSKVVFVSSLDLVYSAAAIDQARRDGFKVVVLPQAIRAKLAGITDLTGTPVRSLDVFVREWSSSFKFEFVDEHQLAAKERAIFGLRNRLIRLAGGKPDWLKEILVSETMRPDSAGRTDAVGVWDPANGRIIIRRDQLQSIASFAGTLIHELVHAQTGHGDVTVAFEHALTEQIGGLAATLVSTARSTTRTRR
jgi:hypothetical protein